jgi:hypothetical protein
VPEGNIIALNGEAGYQAEVLRGGFHIGLWRWQYRIHRVPLVVVPQGKIAYVYARDGEPLAATQTLGRVTCCNNFQDARAFLCATGDGAEVPGGQRGRQRAILREGVYAINLAVFVVLTEDNFYTIRSLQTKDERDKMNKWQQHLAWMSGFGPIVIGAPVEATDPIHSEHRRVVDSLLTLPRQTRQGPSLLRSIQLTRSVLLRCTMARRWDRARSLHRRWVRCTTCRTITTTFKTPRHFCAPAAGDAELARSRKQAEQTVVMAQAESQKQVLAGRGEGSRALQHGLAEASVLLKKIASFGDPRLYALTIAADHLAQSRQPLVPERLFVAGGDGQNGQSPSSSQGLLGTLISLLVSEKSGFQASGGDAPAGLSEFAERMAKESLQSLEHAAFAASDVLPAKTTTPTPAA